MSESDPAPGSVPSQPVDAGAEPEFAETPAPLDPNDPNMPERRVGY